MMTADTLVLDADFRPHATVGWQDALCLLFSGKARVLHEYPDWQINSASLTIKVPAVLLLVKYIGFRQPVRFNRINVYARDHYTCQYCGKSAGLGKPLRVSDLTFDHILPRSRGGTLHGRTL